ncbi:taste receptor type 1 member 1 [Megalops cyprinoides]|uniref:taste receptor type 1 member 1 n=1 Tax=Megalops cyprinoides TaxID=118141 RepID=UPI001864F529|nr:taste receptor type 1 member 1 [Megalops cyprinoides]
METSDVPPEVKVRTRHALIRAERLMTPRTRRRSRPDLSLRGDYNIAGLFPLYNTQEGDNSLPVLGHCNEGTINKHGYHLMQAMRFAVEEINNGTRDRQLLPGVTLGYQVYDVCSLSADTLATIELLAQRYGQPCSDCSEEDLSAVGVIGPDSSSFAFIPAAVLGSDLVPQISYEASNEMLSNKYLYPAFFRTIPSDKNQVNAMIELLRRFEWTWIALLGSDNDYGLQGMQSLSELAPHYDICIAYQAVIPAYTDGTRAQIQQMVTKIIHTRVNTIVVFSSKRIVSGFFRMVIEQNVTGKVWIGTEDWSVATLVSGIPGIRTIGTVLGTSVKYTPFSGFQAFEDLSGLIAEQNANKSVSWNGTCVQSVTCLQDSDLITFTSKAFPLEKYDITSSFNVYKAVYALAHSLHSLLDCDSGECKTVDIQPWQLLQKLKQVNFSIGETLVYFDKNGDPPTGYDIVTWDWMGDSWALRVVGAYSPNPTYLEIDANGVHWNSAGPGLVPQSRCSPDCPPGYRKLQTGQHKCCFDCQACPAATFLNKSGDTSCQPCQISEWSLPKSEVCLQRTVAYLPWDDPLAVALLVMLALTELLIVGTALTFLLHLGTPVVKSAGGRTCLVMLTSLAAAASSGLCHFGVPSGPACLLKQSLFVLSFTVCLACVAVRSFQLVCIFKFSNKLPRAYGTWARNNGPQAVILVVSGVECLISLLRLLLDPPQPSQEYSFYADKVILECSKTLSAGAVVELGYVALLSTLCFCLSYLGKDLPANYSEAKCITFSLLLYMISWISFFTVYCVHRDKYVMAMQVAAILASVLGILGGYFMPKVYIILLRPQMNTTGHFQNCIQMYTMTKE